VDTKPQLVFLYCIAGNFASTIALMDDARYVLIKWGWALFQAFLYSSVKKCPCLWFAHMQHWASSTLQPTAMVFCYST